jgi:hypothetical protein
VKCFGRAVGRTHVPGRCCTASSVGQPRLAGASSESDGSSLPVYHRFGCWREPNSPHHLCSAVSDHHPALRFTNGASSPSGSDGRVIAGGIRAECHREFRARSRPDVAGATRCDQYRCGLDRPFHSDAACLWHVGNWSQPFWCCRPGGARSRNLGKQSAQIEHPATDIRLWLRCVRPSSLLRRSVRERRQPEARTGKESRAHRVSPAIGPSFP